jgi:RND family efflux transporter MFP subunit
MRSTAVRVIVALALIGSVVGCDESPETVAEQLRPIRWFAISDVAGGQVRRFSGVVEASDSSSLSFQVGGNVREVRVQQGDAVHAGQVLAILDTEPYELSVQAAEADLQRTRAYLAQARTDYERHQRLLAQRAVAQAQFDVAQRNFHAATSEVDVAVARLNLARRDFRNTTLTAPFDGTIAARLVDPFVQVAAGQELFRIDAAGGRQVSIAVPETTIAQVSLGMPATVTVSRSVEPIEARVSEIGSAAAAGNAFPVKLALIDPPAEVRPGMTAEVSLLLPHANSETTYFVPLSAIGPGDLPGEGSVFIYDPASSTVRRTLVKSAGPLASNMVAISGVALGDIVATAGVSFLVDGQKVRLMEPPGEALGR